MTIWAGDLAQLLTAQDHHQKDKNDHLVATKMSQQVTALAVQAWQPKFDPQNPRKGGRREPTS